MSPPLNTTGTARRGWAEGTLPLALVVGGLLLGAWRAGATTVPARQAFETQFQACTRRVAAGYATSSIRISAEDAFTIEAACERAVRERLQRQELQ